MGERLISDFTVRTWESEKRGRVEVIGNRSGRSDSEPCGKGMLLWAFALLRVLKRLGAFTRRGSHE